MATEPPESRRIRGPSVPHARSASTDQQVIGFAKSAPGNFYAAEIAGFPGFDWTVVVEQPTAVAFAPIQELTRVQETLAESRIRLLIVLAVAFVLVAALAIYASNLLANNIIGPIRQLQVLADGIRPHTMLLGTVGEDERPEHLGVEGVPRVQVEQLDPAVAVAGDG